VVWTSNADGVELQTSLIPGGLTLNATLNTHDHLVGLVQDAKRLLHHHLRLLMGTQDHALTFPADDLCVSELTLTLGRPMSEVYTNCSQSPLEPIEEDFLSLRLALTFPRFTSNEEQLLSWRQDYTRLQADLLYTHPTTGQTKRLVLPNLVLVTAQAPTTGPGARTLSVEASISRGDDVTTTTAATFAAADNSITLGTGTFPHLAPGAQLTVSGATTAGNNGTFKVVTWTATKVTLATPPTLVDEAAGASVSIATSNPIIYMTES
jgi:hypothetical protein